LTTPHLWDTMSWAIEDKVVVDGWSNDMHI
jgi:hypothetical protein